MPFNDDGTRKEKGTFYMKYQGNHGAFPFKESPMHGCGPGEDGCGGNFKINKRGTVVSRAFEKAGNWVKGGIANIKKSNRIRKNNKTSGFANDDQTSWKTPRHL